MSVFQTIILALIVGVVIWFVVNQYLLSKEKEKRVLKDVQVSAVNEHVKAPVEKEFAIDFSNETNINAVSVSQWLAMTPHQQHKLFIPLFHGTTENDYSISGKHIFGVLENEKNFFEAVSKIIIKVYLFLVEPTIHSDPQLDKTWDIEQMPMFLYLVQLKRLFSLAEYGSQHVDKEVLCSLMSYALYQELISRNNNLILKKVTIARKIFPSKIEEISYSIHILHEVEKNDRRRFRIAFTDKRTNGWDLVSEIVILNSLIGHFVLAYNDYEKGRESTFSIDENITLFISQNIGDIKVIDPSIVEEFKTFMADSLKKKAISEVTKDLLNDPYTAIFTALENKLRLVDSFRHEEWGVKLDLLKNKESNTAYKQDLPTMRRIFFSKGMLKDIFVEFFSGDRDVFSWYRKQLSNWLKKDHAAFKEFELLASLYKNFSQGVQEVTVSYFYDNLISNAKVDFKRNPVEFYKAMTSLTESIGEINPYLFFECRRGWEKKLFEVSFEKMIIIRSDEIIDEKQLLIVRKQIKEIQGLKNPTFDQIEAWGKRTVLLKSNPENDFSDSKQSIFSRPHELFEKIGNLYDDLFNRVSQPVIKE